MKVYPSTNWWFVITADQRRSRSHADRVPRALASVAEVDELELEFERTAGDEIQGLAATATGCVQAIERLLRVGQFRLGIGVGPVEQPLPDSTRAARGSAYLAARQALESASAGIAVRTLAQDHHTIEAVDRAETALLALSAVVTRRSPQGWQVVDLLRAGLSGAAAANRLGITPSAVSQRLARADHQTAERLVDLASWLLHDTTPTLTPATSTRLDLTGPPITSGERA